MSFSEFPSPTPRKEETMSLGFWRRKRGRIKDIQRVRRQFLQSKGLPFTNLLDTRVVSRIVEEECPGSRSRIFSPMITVWAFLTQVMDDDHSCRKAVARVQAWRASQRLPRCSARTSAYCQARKRLPETLLRRMLQWVGRKLHEDTPAQWRWKGRNVKVVDGSTVTMPDTEENQAAYPQQRAQGKGLGFPIARLVAVFSLATGAVMDLALGKFRGGKSEKALLHEIWNNVFEPGDLLLGDRHFVGYCDIAFALQNGVDVCLRQHQARKTDFRKGTRLGPGDHLVTWTKPRQCPRGFPKELYLRLPPTLRLREVKYEVRQKGFRTQSIILVSSLLDAMEVTKEELADLFRLRWDGELDLRSLKDVLQMDILRCKTPAMVRKEIYAHLIVYNLLRGVIAQSAYHSEFQPLELSFKGALQTLDSFVPSLLDAAKGEYQFLKQRILEAISSHEVRNRPDRYEPRALKRRLKPYDLLLVPRHQARKRLEKRTA